MTKKLEGAGLRGQSAGQTSLSTVEQEGSLRYLGYSIEDLAKNASFEEVAYLLLLISFMILKMSFLNLEQCQLL